MNSGKNLVCLLKQSVPIKYGCQSFIFKDILIISKMLDGNDISVPSKSPFMAMEYQYWIQIISNYCEETSSGKAATCYIL